ncbi:MAG: hypothetical protein ACRD3G_00775 [Vicinamibacterales bacterium]
MTMVGGHGLRAQGAESAAERFARGWANGTAASVTGQVSVFQTDDAAGNSGMTQSIRDERTGEWFVLRFESGFPRFRSGAHVRVTGRTSGSELYVAAGCCDGSMTNAQVMSQPPAGASGDQRTLVMIGDLLDAAVPCTTENVRDTLFAPPPATLDQFGTGLSINAEYQASSYGRVTWSGQTVRTTLKMRTTDACSLSEFSAALDAQAAASGVDVASFPRKLYVLPQIGACPFIGASTIGGSSSSSFSLSCTNRGLYSHELGHALGMSHAASYYDAYTAGSGQYNNLLAEYNDYSDSMGSSGWELRGFNAPHREQMGWLSQGATQIVTQSGRYSLAPLSSDPSSVSAPQLIKIPRSEGGFYYLSYRGGQAFDRYSPSYIPQVSVHRHGAPTEAVSGFTVLYATLANGQTGRDTFTDPVNGISVRMVSGFGPAPGPGAIVDIDIQQACVRTAPTVQIAPQNQSGAAGGSLNYTVSITNKDAASCPAATFSLSGISPAGWSGSFSSGTLTLAPGVNGQALLTVNSTVSSAAGTYTTRVNTSGTASIVHATSTDATYTVVDTVAPSQPIALTATAVNKLKQIQLAWRPSTDNLAVSFYLISRNGVTVGTTTATDWSDTAWTPGASYAYVVRAVDAAGNTSQPSNAATITLSGGGGGKRR